MRTVLLLFGELSSPVVPTESLDVVSGRSVVTGGRPVVTRPVVTRLVVIIPEVTCDVVTLPEVTCDEVTTEPCNVMSRQDNYL